ncbi:MAG: hypothetical protein E7511_01700 [Ruminococcus sp.]|nr:hypothetical protein [Ruminococcus sp.]
MRSTECYGEFQKAPVCSASLLPLMIQRNYDLLHINTKLFCHSLSTVEIFSVMHKQAITNSEKVFAEYA